MRGGKLNAFDTTGKEGDGIALGARWMGAEGEDLGILASDGDRFKETGITAARYLSPI